MSVFTLLRSALQCLQTSLNRPLPWFHYSQRSSPPNNFFPLLNSLLSSNLASSLPRRLGLQKYYLFLFQPNVSVTFFSHHTLTHWYPLRNFLPSSPPHSPFLSVPSNPSDNSIPLQKGFYGYIRDASLLYSAFSPAVMSLHYSMQYSPYHNIRHSYTLRHSLYYYMFPIPLFYHHINCNRLAIPPTATVFCRIPRAERLYSTSSSGNTSLQSQHSISPLPSCLTHRFLLWQKGCIVCLLVPYFPTYW